jgi:hypothetical protein
MDHDARQANRAGTPSMSDCEGRHAECGERQERAIEQNADAQTRGFDYVEGRYADDSFS